MITIDGRKAIITETVLLGKDENSILVEGDYGLRILIRFMNDGTGKPSVSSSFSDGKFQLILSSFGSALGTAVSGSMIATTATSHPRPGAWKLRYSLAVHTVGDHYRQLTLTVAEENSA
ncbi:hypothetical protein [Agrobacterium pusense]|uniref:hypothetical protein n=1 Tax=Agrobacterium pusense TaxID=648995 RepID=UPI002FDE7610